MPGKKANATLEEWMPPVNEKKRPVHKSHRLSNDRWDYLSNITMRGETKYISIFIHLIMSTLNVFHPDFHTNTGCFGYKGTDIVVSNHITDFDYIKTIVHFMACHHLAYHIVLCCVVLFCFCFPSFRMILTASPLSLNGTHKK